MTREYDALGTGAPNRAGTDDLSEWLRTATHLCPSNEKIRKSRPNAGNEVSCSKKESRKGPPVSMIQGTLSIEETETMPAFGEGCAQIIDSPCLNETLWLSKLHRLCESPNAAKCRAGELYFVLFFRELPWERHRCVSRSVSTTNTMLTSSTG